MKKCSMVLALVALIAFSMLSLPAMAEEVDWSLPYQGEEVTIRIFGWESYSPVDENSMFGKWLQEKLGNVKIEYEIPASDADTQIMLYLTSGADMPDIHMYRRPAEFMNFYGDGSRTVNLLDYAEYMPSYMAAREKYPHLSWYDAPGGESYLYLPVWYNSISEVWFQNQDLMDKYGLETPTTWDEMKACMEVVCEGEGNVDGLITISWGFDYIFGQYASLLGSRGMGPATVSYDYDQNKWIFPLAENADAYKYMTEELAEAYAKGWINKDFLTREDTDAKMVNGEFLFVSHYYNEATTKFDANGVNVTYIDPPSAEGVTPYVSTSYIEDTTGWNYMITNTAQYPELCAAILDLLGSEEYAVAAYWGIEGESFITDDNGDRQYTEAYLNMDPEDRKTTFGIAKNPPYCTDPFVSNYYVGDAICANYVKPSLDALITSAEKLSSGAYETYYAATAPAFDDIQSEDVAAIATPLKTYISENLTKFIIGTRDLAEWDAFLADLAGYGDVDALLEMYNTAEQRPMRKQQADREWLEP